MSIKKPNHHLKNKTHSRAEQILKLSATLGVIAVTSDFIDDKINKKIDNTQLSELLFTSLTIYGTMIGLSFLGTHLLQPAWKTLTSHKTEHYPFVIKSTYYDTKTQKLRN